MLPHPVKDPRVVLEPFKDIANSTYLLHSTIAARLDHELNGLIEPERVVLVKQFEASTLYKS